MNRLRCRGEWSPDRSYLPGDVVRRSTDAATVSEIDRTPVTRTPLVVAVATAAVRGDAPEDGGLWLEVPGRPRFRGEWDPSEVYLPGDFVNRSSIATDEAELRRLPWVRGATRLFMATEASQGEAPALSKWAEIGASGPPFVAADFINLVPSPNFEDGEVGSWAVGTDYADGDGTLEVTTDWAAKGTHSLHVAWAWDADARVNGDPLAPYGILDLCAGGEKLDAAPRDGATHLAGRMVAHNLTTDIDPASTYMDPYVFHWDEAGVLVGFGWGFGIGFPGEDNVSGNGSTVEFEDGVVTFFSPPLPMQTNTIWFSGKSLADSAFIALTPEVGTFEVPSSVEFDLDACELYLGDETLALPDEYFDGDTTPSAGGSVRWTGTPNASASEWDAP